MNLIKQITDYILLRGCKFFSGWTREALEDYVIHHLNQGTISVVVDGEAVNAVVIGWAQVGDEHIKWNWQSHDPSGDHWWWDQFFADSPYHGALAIVDLCERFPLAAHLPSVAFRRGKVRKYNKPNQLMNIYKKAENLYGNAH